MSYVFFFLMIRRPPRSTLDRSSAASDVYKRQLLFRFGPVEQGQVRGAGDLRDCHGLFPADRREYGLSLIHISEPTRPY